jgi:polysaccharide pyruvyl transferase WcaK-like protein
VGQQSVRHVLIVNQHGDNRGDEAALHGMLSGVSAAADGPVRFTVIHQFANDHSAKELARSAGFDVEWITLKLSPIEGIRLVAFLALGRFVGAKFFLGRIGRATIDAYESADVVVSAPGGPYFGDIYIGHEPVHWLYVWMARMFAKPSMLFATSAGPFAKRWANPFRRFTYRTFDALWVREEISAAHIRALFGSRRRNVEVNVSVDAALQVSVSAMSRDASRRLIVVSAIDRPYDSDPAPDARRARYDTSVAAAVTEMCSGAPSDVVLVPQLHDSVHRDTPYLERLASQVRTATAAAGSDAVVSVFDESRDMLAQRGLFASADFVVAGRYHPAVFALSAGVAQLCIPYEHKATGVLQLAGLSDVVVPIDEVTPESLVAAARHVVDNADGIRARSRDASMRLAEVSSRTSRAVVALIEGAL